MAMTAYRIPLPTSLFALHTDWLLRLRHNPFCAYLETRAIDWMVRHQVQGTASD